MLADNNKELRALAVNTILTIHMKISQQTQKSRGEDEEDNREVGKEDDDNKIMGRMGKLDLTKKKAISSSNVRKFCYRTNAHFLTHR